MNRIRAIAVILSMVLFLLGAAGNTEEKTENQMASYEGIKTERTLSQAAGVSLAAANVVCDDEIEDTRSGQFHQLEENTKQKSLQNDQAQSNIVPEKTVQTSAASAVPETQKRVIEVSEEDYGALLKLVEAEASGEDMKGKMLVANVVVNRLKDGSFGSTIKEVIYQRVNGKAQFSPVANGRIDKVVISTETIEAVERVLCGEDESQGALYFVARAYADADNLAWFDQNLTWLFEHDGHEFFA